MDPYLEPRAHGTNSFPEHAIRSGDWSRTQLESLFSLAEWMTRQPRSVLSNLRPDRVVGTLFYQSSTRTLVSFQAATALLGSRYVGFADAKATRAGDFFQETLEDTVRVMSCYADVLVLRHFDDDAAIRAANVATVPLINAGTGDSDHPTQGMLDVWMMTRAFPDMSRVRIGLAGDPTCRALRAIATTAAKFGPAELCLLAPDDRALPAGQKRELGHAGVKVTFADSAAELLEKVDVVSIIPFELPDFHVGHPTTKKTGVVPDKFVFGRELIRRHGNETMILHTGPRGAELPDEADGLPNVQYFDSVRAGLFLRAALLTCLMDANVPTFAAIGTGPDGLRKSAPHTF